MLFVLCFLNDASVAHAYASISWIIYDGSRCLALLGTCLVSLAVFSWVRADHKQDREMSRGPGDTQLIVGVAGKQCCCFLISCAHTLSLDFPSSSLLEYTKPGFMRPSCLRSVLPDIPDALPCFPLVSGLYKHNVSNLQFLCSPNQAVSDYHLVERGSI